MRKNNKVFLGDSGSLFIGGIVAIYVMYICSSEYLILEYYDINKIFFVFSILIYPIIDIIRIIFIRLIRGKSPFSADNNHIHHILLDNLTDHYKVVFAIVLLTVTNFTIIHYLLI